MTAASGLRHCDLKCPSNSSRMAVESKPNRSCNGRITATRWRAASTVTDRSRMATASRMRWSTQPIRSTSVTSTTDDDIRCLVQVRRLRRHGRTRPSARRGDVSAVSHLAPAPSSCATPSTSSAPTTEHSHSALLHAHCTQDKYEKN